MRMKINRKRLTGLALILSMYLTLFGIPSIPVFADTSTGGVNVSTTPQPSDIEVYDDGVYTEANSLTPNDEMVLNFTITDADQLANLTWVRIIVYDQAKAAWDDPNNQTDHTEYFWNEPTDTWNITEESGSTWDINAGSCIDPGTDNAATSFEFTLFFTPGQCAFEETTNQWLFNVTAYDDDSLEGFNTTVTTGSWPSSTAGPADWLGSLTIDNGATSYNFSAASAGGANVSLYLIDGASGTFLNFTVIANGVWDVAVDGSNWTKGGDTINIETNDVQFINDDDWDSNGEWLEQSLNTTSTVYWDGSVEGYNNTQESGSVKNIYMRLAVPAGTPGGFYTQTLTVVVQNG